MGAGSSLQAASLLQQLSVVQALQSIEAGGALEDSAALQTAAHSTDNRQQQVLLRCWLLGQRLGLPAEWARWRHLGWLVAAVFALLMALSAWGLARAVVGEARNINAVAAFVSMLGVHAVMLLVWLLGLLWSYASPASGHGAAGGWSLGALALRLTARLPLDRGPHAAALLQGTTTVLQRHRLAPWAFGALSHSIWALAFVWILLALGFGFAFHAYQLTWETTILSDAFFSRFVRVTGWLPSLLGFAVPDASAVHAAGSHGAGNERAWAWWLMGCVFVYGLLLRAALALLCMAVWQYKQRRLVLDTADPYVRHQLARLDALRPTAVLDPEQRTAAAPASAPLAPAAATGEPALLGFELPPDAPWPPTQWTPPWQTPIPWVERIAGSSAERAAALDRLNTQRPRALLVATWGNTSPDRGTARLVREVQASAGRCAILLLGPAPQTAAVPEMAHNRWRNWLQAEALADIALLTDTAEAEHWLLAGVPPDPRVAVPAPLPSPWSTPS